MKAISESNLIILPIRTGQGILSAVLQEICRTVENYGEYQWNN
jgi:hypothetical protein